MVAAVGRTPFEEYRRAASSPFPAFLPQTAEVARPAGHAMARADVRFVGLVPVPVAGGLRSSSATDWSDDLPVEGRTLPVSLTSQGGSRLLNELPGLLLPRGPARTRCPALVEKGQALGRRQRTVVACRVHGCHRCPLVCSPGRTGPSLRTGQSHSHLHSIHVLCLSLS